jgi:glycosyltransferase involved in cell wall biosynthesis
VKKTNKILVLADFLYPEIVGGSARFASDFNNSLVDTDHEIVVVTRDPSGDYLLAKHNFEDYEVVRMDSVLRVYSLIRSKEWDCIISHHFLLGLLTWLAPNVISKKYFFHGPCYQEHRARGGAWFGTVIRYLLEYFVLLRQHEIYTLSEYMRSKLPKFLKPRARVVGPLHRKYFQDLPVRNIMDSHPIRLLTVRRLTPRTGVKELIELCSRLQNKVHLTVVGKGSLLSELMLNRPDNVSIEGYVDDAMLSDFYKRADLFILPSIELEGFGLVILESLYSGTPVMASSTSGGGAEYLADISEKFIYDRNDSAEIFYAKCQAAIAEFNLCEIRQKMIEKLNMTLMDKFAKIL